MHPVQWMVTTVSTIFSLHTWLCTIPLLMIIVFYGVILGRRYVAERRYTPTRFATLCSMGIEQLLFAVVHIAVSFLTTWLYSRFMQKSYSTFYDQCSNDEDIGGGGGGAAKPPRNCINERYTLLILYGVYTGVYNFVNEPARNESRIAFPLLQQERYLKVRDNLTQIFWAGVCAAILPTIAFFVGSCLLSGVLISNMASIFGLHYAAEYNHFFDGLLFCYLCLLAAQLQINQRVMHFLFVTMLTEYRRFEVSASDSVSLTDALGCSSVPITQELAALDLYTLSQASASRRREVFALSVPGDHPYVWQALSGQCMALIDAYTQDLARSIEHMIVAPQYHHSHLPHPKFYRPSVAVGGGGAGGVGGGGSASDLANRIMLRQYNESFGIRNMMDAAAATSTTNDEPMPTIRTNDPLSRVTNTFSAWSDRLRMACMKLPGVEFWFGEQRCGRVGWLLANRGQMIGWTVQGLATMATSSLLEDTYGVVQINLVQLIRSLLSLKQTLDRVVTVTFEEPMIHSRAVAIRGIVRRSLYSITTTFAECLPELMTASPEELRTIQNFMSYSEV